MSNVASLYAKINVLSYVVHRLTPHFGEQLKHILFIIDVRKQSNAVNITPIYPLFRVKLA